MGNQKNKGIGNMNDEEFQEWMADYFKDKSPQDLRNILISHEPQLKKYFDEHPLHEDDIQK